MKPFRFMFLTCMAVAVLAAPSVSYAGSPGYVMMGHGNYAMTNSLGKAVGSIRRVLLQGAPVCLSSGYLNRLKIRSFGGSNLTYISR